MNNRRKLVIALGAGALTAPFGSFAQQQGKVWRVGYLGPTSPAKNVSQLEAFRAGLRDLGYIEGKNLVIEFRWAEEKYERFPELAAELVHLNIDALVTMGTPGTRAAKQATATIPIVSAVSGDAVAAGLIASLAQPGANVTGSTFFSPELHAKRLELIKEAVPRIARIGFLMNPVNSGSMASVKLVEAAAKSLKVELRRFQALGTGDIESAFAGIAKGKFEAVLVHEDAMINTSAKAIAGLATKYRLPSAGRREYADAGGLIGYGPSIPEMFRRAAYFLDRILKGTKPADLPVEQPTKFELVVNMKTAKTLGLKIPNSILVQAIKVIE
jgi:putative ABC transport system substrate-binding protein